MKKERLIVSVLSSILLVSFLSFVVSAQTEAETNVEELFKLPIVKQVIGLVFGVWNLDDVYSYGEIWGISPSEPSTKIGAVIIYLMIWLILFVAFGDIISLFSPFTEWVGWVIGLALAIVAAQLRWIYSMSAYVAGVTAALGAIGLFVGIIFSIAAFVALSFGSVELRKWAVRRKMAIQKVKALSGRAKAIEGLKTMKDVGKEVGKE